MCSSRAGIYWPRHSKGNLNLGEIAKQFNVTPERVTQIVKDVKDYEIRRNSYK